MLTMLMEELEKIGLHFNNSKTEILTTVQNPPHFWMRPKILYRYYSRGKFTNIWAGICRGHYP